jgi:signal transduction histidine kinase/DNA-binding response OmpR family regulator
MKYTFFFYLIISVILGKLNAQTPQLDSLYKILNTTEEKKSRIHLINEIGNAYLKVDLDSAMSFAEQALKLNSYIDLTSETAKSFMTLGKVNLYIGQLSSSKQYYDSANVIYRQIENHSGMAESFNKKGLCLMLLENFDDSEKNLDSALMFAKQAKDSTQIIRAYLNFSSLNHYIGDYDKSLEYLYKALEVINLTDNLELKITAYLNLGSMHLTRGYMDKALQNLLKVAEYCEKSTGKEKQLSYCYQRIGYIYLDKGDAKRAGEHGLKSLENARNVHLSGGLVATYSLIGLSALEQNNFDKALEYCTQALDLSQKLELPKLIADCYYDLGQVYLNKEDYGQSIKYLKKPLKVFETLENKFSLSKNFELLARAYAGNGNFEKAYFFRQKHDLLQDTLLSEKNERQLLELETEFEVKEKEAKIELQNSQIDLKNEKISQQRILNFIIGLIAILFIVIAILAYLNIKRRKRMNEQLKSLDRAKSRFFTNISHEMRNPLTLIIAPLENLSEKAKNTPFYEELQLAYSNSKKLLERVNEILDLSKLESGELKLIESPVVLHGLCRRILFSYQSLAHYRNMKLEFDFMPDKTLTVLLDIEKFEKILNNLILNAFKHSETEGQISLKINTNDNLLNFIVKDTGQGIHPNDLKQIFNRYYQAEWRDQPALGGTGIGLTLAKEYAQLSGGDITVESTPGKGSSFTLTIPLKKTEKPEQLPEVFPREEVPEKEENVINLPLSVDGQKPKILIVEDELELSKYLMKCLSGDYYCKSAPDGLAALKLLNIEQFDLIISDVMMPRMDGLQFRGKVRENMNWKQIPFIMLTAKALDEDKIAGLQLGVDDYITKPFNTKELIARVHNLIINKQERDTWKKENKEETESEVSYSAEEQLIIKAEKHVIANLQEHSLNASSLASSMGYSLRQLERLLKKHSGLSPAAFIREIRLQKAYRILEKRQFATIKEVCYDVGMDTPANFSTRFKQRFGKNPTEVC